MSRKVTFICLLAALAATPLRADAIFATVVKTIGPITSMSVGGQTKVGPPGAHVGPGEMVMSGPGGSALLKLTACSALRMGADASLSVDRLQLVKGLELTTTRSGDFTLFKGDVSFIFESMQARVNLPGAVLSVGTAAVFHVVVEPSGDALISVLSGRLALTDSSGETVHLKGGEFSAVNAVFSGKASLMESSGGILHVNAREPSVVYTSVASQPASVSGNPEAEGGLVMAQQTLEEAVTLSLVCEDTVERFHGEFLQLPSEIRRPIKDDDGRVRRRSRSSRPPVSPER